MLTRPIKRTNRGYMQRGRVDSHNHRPRAVENDNPIKNEELYEEPTNTILPKHCLIISLPQSWETRLEPLLKENPFKGETVVIEAIDGSKLPKVEEGIPLKQGDLGCLMSHIKALEYARDNKFECVMILEDDVKFEKNFNEKLAEAMKELPERWDMLWIGGSDAKPSYPYTPHLKRLNGSWGTYGYILRDNLYEYFIELFSEGKRSSDDYFRINHPRFLSFRTVLNLVIHTGKVSDRLVVNHAAAK